MIRINKHYINRFTCSRYEYLYPLNKGIYLAFDRETLEYIGIEMFYLPRTQEYQKQADDLINKLLARDILETTL